MKAIWEEVRPSRIEVIATHSKRILNTWGNSRPYLSGDLYSDSSDYSFQPPKMRRFQNIEKDLPRAEVIFCPSNLLESFFEEYLDEIRAKVIICSNGDYDFHELPSRIPKSVRHFFLQNSFIPNSEMTTAIPIGIENLRWGKNGFSSLMKVDSIWTTRSNRILLGPFGMTHEERKAIRNTFTESNEEIELISERFNPREYSRLMSQHKYVACVRGNGVDTHRHWESMYRGCYAVTLSNNWSDNFKDLGLPILFIEDWSQEQMKKISISKLPEPQDPKNVEALWWPYWKSKIEGYL
jgi:hypothetical protein